MSIITKRTLTIVIILVILLFLFFIIKSISLWSGFYINNNSLDKETNKEIKSLLLNVMKNRHSKLFSMNDNRLFTEEYLSEHMQYTDSSGERSILISIDSNFMDSVEKTSDSEYKAEVKLKWPGDWHYYFLIKVIDDRYFISSLEIDP